MFLATTTVDGLHTIGFRTYYIIVYIFLIARVTNIPSISIIVRYLCHCLFCLIDIVIRRKRQWSFLAIDLYPKLVAGLLGQRIVTVDITGL